jgi:hypothetical protein
LPLGTEEEVAGDPAGVMVERSESEKRRPDGEARNELTQRVTNRAGASQRAIDAGRGGDTMTNPSRPPNAQERRAGDSMSTDRRCCSAGHSRWEDGIPNLQRTSITLSLRSAGYGEIGRGLREA